MTTQLDTATLENLRDLNSKVKSKYFAGSRITQDIKRRKWYEKMSNVRSGFLLDLQDVSEVEALQPGEEMQRAQHSLEDIRERLPQNNKEEKESQLKQELIQQEEEVEAAYKSLKKEVGAENDRLFHMLEVHEEKIHNYIEKLKSF
jgi:ribosomal protein S21